MFFWLTDKNYKIEMLGICGKGFYKLAVVTGCIAVGLWCVYVLQEIITHFMYTAYQWEIV